MLEVYLDPTQPAMFDEARIKRVAQRLMGYLISAFGTEHLDDYDDYVQEALFKLWQFYRKDPNGLMARSDHQLYGLAKGYCRNAAQSAYQRKCQHHRQGKGPGAKKTLTKRLFTLAELVGHYAECSQDDIAERLLVGASVKTFTHDSPQVREVDTRLDLADLLRRGLATLHGRQRTEIILLLTDLAAGYSQVEMAQRHRWTESHLKALMRLMRSTFLNIACGQKYQPGVGTFKPKCTQMELQRISELHQQGLSYRQIAARIGRSPGFVYQKLANAPLSAAS